MKKAKTRGQRKVLFSLIFCAILTLLVGVWTYSSLDHLDKDWRVVDEHGMTVANSERKFYFLRMIGSGISVADAERMLSTFGYHLERIEEPRLSDSDDFPALILCVLATLFLAIVYGIQCLVSRHGSRQTRAPAKKQTLPDAETAATADLDSRDDRLENLRRLCDAGLLTREELEERKRKL